MARDLLRDDLEFGFDRREIFMNKDASTVKDYVLPTLQKHPFILKDSKVMRGFISNGTWGKFSVEKFYNLKMRFI